MAGPQQLVNRDRELEPHLRLGDFVRKSVLKYWRNYQFYLSKCKQYSFMWGGRRGEGWRENEGGRRSRFGSVRLVKI